MINYIILQIQTKYKKQKQFLCPWMLSIAISCPIFHELESMRLWTCWIRIHFTIFSTERRRNFIILYPRSLADKRPCVASLHAYTQLKWPINDRPCLSVSVCPYIPVMMPCLVSNISTLHIYHHCKFCGQFKMWFWLFRTILSDFDNFDQFSRAARTLTRLFSLFNGLTLFSTLKLQNWGIPPH